MNGSPLPRLIRQPGPPPAERIVAVAGRGRPVALTLEAGLPLAEAVARAFSAHGFRGGTVVMDGVALEPFAYVMPALSKTGENAAFYSDRFAPEGVARIDRGAMSFGRRDGAPFFHCHALWTEADGTRSGGHILPDGTALARTAVVPGFGFAGGVFQADPDPETNFKLFGPVPDDQPAGGGSRAFLLRVRPNQDFAGALERFCTHAGIARARVHGGVGSTIGARFEDGTQVVNFATEVYIHHGEIAPGHDGSPEARLDVGLVDYTGQMAEGRLLRGDNPVLMTFELALEDLGDPAGARP